jgi:hypothetical protein
MKRFVVREVETLKTTAAFYDCGCGDPCPVCPWYVPQSLCNLINS